MRVIDSYVDKSANGIKDRITSFVYKIVNAEKSEGSFYTADKRWVGFDRLIGAIREKVEIEELINSAYMLLDEQEGYLVNAGLSILALADVIDVLKDKESTDKIRNLFLSFIPKEDKLSSLGVRDPEMYNFIRAVEGLLCLDSEGIWQEGLTNEHIRILKECVEAPDMEGTLIKKKYGESEKTIS